MNPPHLPRTPRELFRYPVAERFLYGAALRLAEIVGLWEYPARAYATQERMRLVDRLYWLHKSLHPTRRAAVGSGLEQHFDRARKQRIELPRTFRASERLRISAVGDLNHHPFLLQSADTLYARVEDAIFDADLTMASLEGSIRPGGGSPLAFAFGAPPVLAYDRPTFDVVRGRGDRAFSFMATACNHALDFGAEGLDATLDVLDECGIAHAGTQRTEAEADGVTVVERGGFRIGLIAYTFGLNTRRRPPGRPRAVHVLPLNDGARGFDASIVQRHLDDARRRGCDAIIGHLHWGMEHEFYPTPAQVELAHLLAELGFDALVGHHPRVIQPLERYRTRRDPHRIVPIYYSLGTLINPFSAEHLCRSGVARLVLARGEVASGVRRTYVESASMLEVEQRVDLTERRVHLVPGI